MRKTTVYLGEKELQGLKMLAAKRPGQRAAGLIREAVRELLRKKQSTRTFQFLKKALRRKPRRSSFGDPVRYQRSLRAEWS